MAVFNQMHCDFAEFMVNISSASRAISAVAELLFGWFHRDIFAADAKIFQHVLNMLMTVAVCRTS